MICNLSSTHERQEAAGNLMKKSSQCVHDAFPRPIHGLSSPQDVQTTFVDLNWLGKSAEYTHKFLSFSFKVTINQLYIFSFICVM